MPRGREPSAVPFIFTVHTGSRVEPRGRPGRPAQPTADSARGGYARPNLAAMASSFETGARLVPQAAPRGQDPGGGLQTKFSYPHATVAKL